MQASTLRILEAAQFQPPQARPLAEAIEGEIRAAEIVTVPILDSRIAGLKTELKEDIAGLRQGVSESENRLFNRMVLLGLTAVGMIISAVFFIVLNLKR